MEMTINLKKTNPQKATWLLVDGHNMAFRCFYGIPEMTTKDGMPVNAIYGWIRSLWKLEDMIRPDAVCIFFDSGRSVDRTNILGSYKSNRQPTPEGLKQQFHHLNLISIAHGYYVIAQPGTEADDLLFSFAKKLENFGETSYIASGDKDFCQCINDNIFQLLPPHVGDKANWEILNKNAVKEKFGIFPEQMVDYLSLLGDASDNIMGVKGIGKKRSSNLLNEFGNIETIFQNIEKIPSSLIRENLMSSMELIETNRKLITLKNIDGIIPPEAKILRNTSDIFQLLEDLHLNAALKLAHKRYTDQQELF